MMHSQGDAAPLITRGDFMTELRYDRPARKPESVEIEALDIVRDALANIRFGGIHLTVHEGQIVQMDIMEKRRFV